MTASDSAAHQSAVIAADPSMPFAPRRLITDLLRTRYCIPGSTFLVEGVETHIPVSNRYRTVRLLLGDGELCLQALLRPEVHRFVDSCQVFVGSYVRLNRFEVRSVQARPGHDGAENGSEEPEEMVILVAWDVSIVGWNTAYIEMAGVTLQDIPAEAVDSRLGNRSESSVAQKEGRTPGASKPLLDEQPVVHSKNIASEKSKDRHKEAESQQQPRDPSTSNYLASGNLPWTSNNLTRPLKLTPLRAIPHLPYKQNWIVNILAIVASLSDVEPAGLPPFKQRTARLADPSTSKQVHLTVFLDADEFAPAVGSVVLLLGVKNHRFDGGSLKKYGNEKRRETSPWWLENPKDVEWCDVDGLEKWWSERPA